MKKSEKIVIGILSFMFIIAIAAFFGIRYFLTSIRTECEKQKAWNLKTYEIVEYQCIGFAGPPWYPFDLYENGQLLASRTIRTDSCRVKFELTADSILVFNFCKKELLKRRKNETE
jgi:hypothetical protein